LLPPFTVSTKGVHGLWIIMWMSNQYHPTSQHLAHCPITRHHNLCNFIKMQFIIKNSYWKNFAILQHDWTCKNKPMPVRRNNASTRAPRCQDREGAGRSCGSSPSSAFPQPHGRCARLQPGRLPAPPALEQHMRGAEPHPFAVTGWRPRRMKRSQPRVLAGLQMRPRQPR
jgi:hypothetical protein